MAAERCVAEEVVLATAQHGPSVTPSDEGQGLDMVGFVRHIHEQADPRSSVQSGEEGFKVPMPFSRVRKGMLCGDPVAPNGECGEAGGGEVEDVGSAHAQNFIRVTMS